MIIALTPEIESALAAQSQRRGLTSDEFAQQLLLDKLRELEAETSGTTNGQEVPEEPEEPEGTLADMLAGYVGVVEGKGIVSARNTGKQFTEILLQKRRERRERREAKI